MEPTSSQFVLSKLSGLLSGASAGENRQRRYWMPDDLSLECAMCTSKFTSFRRRHHCRSCGQVFCSKCCSSFVPGKQMGYTGNIRVCTNCNDPSVLEQTEPVRTSGQAPDREESPGPGPVTVTFRRRQSIDQVAQMNCPQITADISSPTFRKNRKVSTTVPLYAGESEPDGETSDPESGVFKEMVKLKDPQTLRRLWSRVLDPEEGLRLETHRYYFRSYPGTFQGSRLVDWLVSQDSHTHTSRAQAVAIGQALLSGGLMSSVAGQEQFSDGTELYQPVTSLEPSPVTREDTDLPSPGHGVQEPAWLQDLPNYSVCDEATAATENNIQDEDENVVKTEDRESVSLIEVDIGELKESVVVEQGESDETAVLDSVYRQHEAEYLQTLLRAENVPEVWRETITSLAERAVSTVIPSVRHGDEMDILTYVKVKCVAGGEMSQCRLVEGEVCSLQLTHKDMENIITNPRIALVYESIMFKDRNAMVSLETVQLQEAEYIKNVIGKLLDLRPNLVLVEKSVTHLAQEILRREGVSLAVNVKPKVLSRLSRLIEGSIIKSVDTLMTAPKLGTCELVTSEMAGKEERLLLFEGCKPSLGGTILLRGGDRRFLSKVKAILRRLILIKYNWKHERSFLSNEYASLMDSNIRQVFNSDGIE